jgi:hypothetical protein
MRNTLNKRRSDKTPLPPTTAPLRLSQSAEHEGVLVTCNRKYILGSIAIILLTAIGLSCGADNNLSQTISSDICGCLPLQPDAADYRHAAKHTPLPGGTPQEITVATILGWPQDPVLPFDQPRAGRELQLVHVSTAFLDNASVNPDDCDVHMEISDVADLNAPRVIVETPVDSEYCTARQKVQTQLKRHGFTLDAQHGGDLAQPLPVDVLGLPFEDFEHGRGTSKVATLWEIHPAIVTIF